MKSVCAFGDSILKGVILDENKKYRVSDGNFTEICRKTLGIRIDNAGKFGSTIKTGERSLERYGSLEGFDYALLEFGGNDCDYNWREISLDPHAEHKPNCMINDFRDMYGRIVSHIREFGVKPVLLSLVPINSARYFNTVSNGLNAENILEWLKGNVRFITDWHERYNIEIFKLAGEFDVPIIDITSPFLENRTIDNLLCADGIHPNEAGHRLIADSIKKFIEDKFESVERWLESAI